jgi:hypothetical protein
MVMIRDPGYKMVYHHRPHGPYRLLQVTKGGLAILEGREQHRVPPSLLDPVVEAVEPTFIPTMKRSKDDPMQLTLTLHFTNPTSAVLKNLSTLMEIADTVHEAGDTAGTRYADGRASDPCNKHVTPDQKPIRDRLRQLAGCVAVATKQDWHTVWVLAYHRFFKLTGRHPVIESIRLGLPTHLDFVFTDPSWPGVLHNVLEEMLTVEAP